MPQKRAVSSDASVVLEGLLEPALLLSRDYKILVANQAYREKFLCEQEVVDRYCYEVSHGNTVPCHRAGESCPMVGARETGEPQRVLHIHHSPRGDEHVEVEGRPIFDDKGRLRYFVEIIRRTKAASAQAEGKGLVGRSRSFMEMLGLIQRVAPSESTALLLGDSGTGKELVAQAIHDLSPRKHKLFVPVECSGLTESLFESELFGHEKGAFTGAHASKAGLIEAARGGTLFLDEVGDIPLSLQVKLLRLLETGTFRPVGSVESVQADFRLICATHRDLQQMVVDGAFRQDLYYRISSFPILLPTLTERIDDLPLLAESLLKRIKGADRKQLSPEALECLRQYHFPGNVRELRNLLERACLMADGRVIQPAHFKDICQGEISQQLIEPVQDEEILTLEEVENRYLARVASSFQGERRLLAEKLGISERTLFRKLQRLRH